MRANCVFLGMLGLAACAQQPLPADAAPTPPDVGTDAFAWGELPPEPADLTPPVVPCDSDAGFGVLDPCPHWVVCNEGWLVTYIDGACVAGTCRFTEPPTLEYCYTGCAVHTGTWGRCTNPGPTAP